MQLVIVDTGCANISSVYFAFKRLGVDATISRDAKLIKAADKVLLPGVGTAHNAMAKLQQAELIDTLQSLQQPLLGICLGMQLLTGHSMEGNVACLNLIPGEVLPMQSAGLRLPHMGWNTLKNIGNHALMRGFTETDYVYFVHSFAVASSRYSLALCHYGSDFAAVIGKDNVAGAQFHPERSGKTGARLLQNFLEWQL
ncbi:glutamine amidotransferase [Rheinheimera pacifica]|uniref:Imidazole glycerol phosphate synthase subunit HisH n=1 Tax=Rheinheimera pacifica TaxID=173990 RepID=A0A1H6KXR9_9GAMM|nr:imidazole glycerol phosphate synthase subunit HisH [Rheinheimera pacifica]SEH78729.1 glutamine amidotransferase [Rheinheimera pacifica]